MKNITINLNNRDEDVINITLNVGGYCNNRDISVMGKCNGEISSTLHISPKDRKVSRWTRTKYNSMIDALEILILAHACAGVDVESFEYVGGIEAVLKEIDNNLF